MAKAVINRMGDVLGLRVWFGQTRLMSMAHTHNDIEFNYILEGEMTYLISGQVFTIPPGRLAAIWGAMPHQTAASSSGTSLAWGTLPLGSTLLNMLPETFVQQLLGQGIVIDAAHDQGDLPLFKRWERDLTHSTAARRELVTREMELRLHRMALDAPQPSRRNKTPRSSTHSNTTGGQGFALVQRMAGYISERFDSPITASDVADAASLHPNYAMTLFRRHTQMTINTYLTRQRIAHAQRLLATTDEPILNIGMDSGFGSPSRFFEAFRQHAGCSPRAYRQRLAGR